MHFYRAYGLNIRSSVQLPELVQASDAAPDLTITHDDLPNAPSFHRERSVQVRHVDTTIYAHWTGLGTYAATQGRHIRFRPAAKATPAMQRLPLLGVMMGLILHQRGVCTLHGSAVALPQGTAAFIGPKGAGKSTTAAALQHAGYPLLSDDVLALSHHDEDPSRLSSFAIEPAFPQIKLWPDAAQAVGQSHDMLDALAPHLPKRAWRNEAHFATHAPPLHALYVLDFGDTLSMTRLSEREAFVAVLGETYAPRFVGRQGTGVDHFNVLSSFVNEVPVYRLVRPHDLSKLPDLVTLLTSIPSDTPPNASEAHRSTRQPSLLQSSRTK